MRILFLFCSICLVGCADTRQMVFDSTLRTPTTQIDVFDSATRVPVGHVIAELTFLGPAKDELRARQFFVTQAQKLGGNAIVYWKTVAEIGGDGFGNAWHAEYKFLYHAKVMTYEKSDT